MKRVKRSAYALLFAMSLVASLVVPSGVASATSDYDGNYRTTGSVVLEASDRAPYYTACPPVDYTVSWASAMAAALSNNAYNSNNSQADDYLASWEVASSSGRWAVSQEEWTDTNGHSYTTVVAYWTEDTSLALSWTQHSELVIVTGGSSLHSVALRNKKAQMSGSDCNPYALLSTSGGSISSRVGAGGNVSFENLFVHSDHLNIPEGYEGEPISTEAPSAKYVAMGDSFSSGEGVSPFEFGTDVGGVNECHRSPLAYPRLLQADLDLRPTAFVACSGATTNDVLGISEVNDLTGKWNDPAQIDALSEDTEVVTITIGGNNVGFKDFATACTVGSCDFATTAYSDIHGKIVNDLPGVLEDVYEAIDGATSSTADIYVVGYPQIAPAEMPTGPNSACYPLNGGTDNPDPELNDGATAYAVVSELNSVIEDAVTDMNSAKFHFVDPNLSGSPFIGHDWCQQDRYFVQIGVPIPPSNTEYSFHPNVDGQEAYGTVVGGEIS